MAKKVTPEAALSEKQLEIWNRIKDKPVNYYALKDITVEGVCTPMNIDPDVLYVGLKGPAALMSIEEVLNMDVMKNFEDETVPRYLIEMKTKYAMISVNPKAK